MRTTSQPFPQDPKDPFNRNASSNTPDLSPWQSHNHQAAIAPTWNIKTSNERIEQENTIHKLETKLKKLKDRSDKYYFRKATPEVSLHCSSSDSEEELIQHPIEEDQEGLPLLWSSKSVEQAPRKTEDQYTRSKWLCCC